MSLLKFLPWRRCLSHPPLTIGPHRILSLTFSSPVRHQNSRLSSFRSLSSLTTTEIWYFSGILRIPQQNGYTDLMECTFCEGESSFDRSIQNICYLEMTPAGETGAGATQLRSCMLYNNTIKTTFACFISSAQKSVL